MNLDTLLSVSHSSLALETICLLSGGSTIVLLFEKGTLAWDEDLLANGRASIETLVRVGMGLGRKAA
jgi:hypothetical protein